MAVAWPLRPAGLTLAWRRLQYAAAVHAAAAEAHMHAGVAWLACGARRLR
jgi:hypothetical protein